MKTHGFANKSTTIKKRPHSSAGQLKLYTDTSFLVRLLDPDFTSDEAENYYRSIGRPRILLTEILELEAKRALRSRGTTGKREAQAEAKLP